MWTNDGLEPELFKRCELLLARCRQNGLKIASAESCTGGLIAAALTEIPGSSDVLERGFVTYSNDAKIEAIGVPAALVVKHGAVSANVAIAMAEGALKHSHADIAVAVTGIAGPGGGTPQKPVGLVYIAVERKGQPAVVQRFTFGDVGRHEIRVAAVKAALGLIESAIAGNAG